MEYCLKIYDKTLVKFTYNNKIGESEKVNITYFDEENNYLFPVGFKLSSDGIVNWLKRRIMPKNRENAERTLIEMGYSRNDLEGIIRISKCLSVNDAYWVVESDFRGSFDDFNLYDNEFEKALALVVYTGYGSLKAKGFTSSPEFTTNGMLKKAWRRKNGDIVLYKGGTSGASNTGFEPFSEYYASLIGKKAGLNIVSYDLSMWKKELCSVCTLFTDFDTSFVQIYDFVGSIDIVSVSKYLKTLGDSFYNDFVDMIIFDCLIINQDRHYGNFGLLVNSKTNKIKSFAPLFDHGNSLFNYAGEDEFLKLDEYAKNAYTKYDYNLLELARYFITDRQKVWLKKLINFKFEKHSSYNLPAKRLKKIEEFINNRVLLLLGLDERK